MFLVSAPSPPELKQIIFEDGFASNDTPANLLCVSKVVRHATRRSVWFI